MELLTYLHDPDNLYIPLIKETTFPEIVKESTIAISPSTTNEVRDLVENIGFKVIEGGLYGTARLNLIKHALSKNQVRDLFVCDFDKMLHWLKNKPHEFSSIINIKPKADLTVIARSARALSTYPETWQQTEAIAMRILTKITKRHLDFMNGPSILSPDAAKVISQNGIEKGVGSCVEFCMLVNQAGLSLENLEVDGLTWEDPDRYIKLIKQADTFDDWKYDTYHSLYEWRKRVDFLNKQVEVMIRLSEEPINPKYPVVHNKTLEFN